MLDIGCGTGKVARGLIERGLTVLGIELDERMAAVARAHGVTVEVAAFEDWDDGGRTFDLITCGDAWHWIDPVRGWRKIGEVLRPGGTVARLWSHHEVDEPLRSALRRRVRARGAGDRPHRADGTSATRPTRASRTGTTCGTRTYSADDWVALIATYSVHLALAARAARRAPARSSTRRSPPPAGPSTARAGRSSVVRVQRRVEPGPVA